MISVVVPVYNSERYLEKCIRSILDQAGDFELLLIDDGSTDESGKICDRVAEEDARVRVFHQKNAGVSVARNRGIEESRGDYVMFVDSDDALVPNALLTVTQSLAQLQADIVVYAIAYNTNGICTYTTELEDRNSADQAVLPHVLDIYRRGAIASSVNKLYNRSLLTNVRFETGVKYGEDLRFNLQVFPKARSVTTIGKGLYIYNQHENSLSTNVDGKQISDLLVLYDASRKFFSEIGADPAETEAQLIVHYFRYLYPFMISQISLTKKLTGKERNQAVKSICSGDYKAYLARNKKSVFNLLLHCRLYSLALLYCKVLSKIKKR